MDYYSESNKKMKASALLLVTLLAVLTAAVPVSAQLNANNGADDEEPPQTTSRPATSKGQQVQQRELRLRKLMTSFGVAETVIQDAVIIYIEEEARAQRPLRSQGRKLLSALRAKAVDGNAITDAQMRELVAGFRAAMEANVERTVEAEISLDKKIGYTKNPRLEAMLILLGIIGNAPPVATVAIPGQPNRPGPPATGQTGTGQWGSGTLTAQQRREQLEAAQRAALLKQFDKDGDGLLDVAERAAADAFLLAQQNRPADTTNGAAPPPQPAPEPVDEDPANDEAANDDRDTPDTTPDPGAAGNGNGTATEGQEDMNEDDDAESLPPTPPQVDDVD